MQISEQCGSEGWVDGRLQAVARWGEFCFIALEDVENRGADAGEVQRREFLPRSATIFVEGYIQLPVQMFLAESLAEGLRFRNPMFIRPRTA